MCVLVILGFEKFRRFWSDDHGDDRCLFDFMVIRNSWLTLSVYSGFSMLVLMDFIHIACFFISNFSFCLES